MLRSNETYAVILALVEDICFIFHFFQNKIASKLRSEVYPKFTGILESILRENQENNNSSGYFVGDDVRIILHTIS